MWLRLILDDENGKELISQGVTFNDEAILGQLIDKIEFIFNIKRDYQQLFFKDKNLDKPPSYTLSRLEIRDCDEIHVKHELLSMWKALLKRANTFKEAHAEDEKKVIHDGCQDFIKQLNTGSFCSIYPDFAEKFDKIIRMIFSYYYRTREAIESSARIYFENLYHERNPTIEFASRSKGSRRGCICIVKVENTTIKYYIKTHHGGGARDSCTRADLDLKEFLAYRILQELGVGPEVHFVPHDGDSRWILYIASREIPNFKTIEEVESSEMGDLSKYAKAVVQMLCLYIVLNMADHHLANMGVDSHGSPFIVDFFLIGRNSFDVRIDFYDKVRYAEKSVLVEVTSANNLSRGRVTAFGNGSTKSNYHPSNSSRNSGPYFQDLSLSDEGFGSTVDEEEVQSILNDDEMDDFKEEQNINKGKMCLKRAREDARIKKMEDKINLNTQKLNSEQQLLEMKRGKDLEPRNCHRALGIYAAPKTPHYKENKNLEVKKTIEKKQKRLHYLHMMDKMKKAKKDLE